MTFQSILKQNISIEEFIDICKNSNSLLEAITKTNIHKSTFTKYAKELDCYFPNAGGKGISKNIPPRKFDINKWNNDELIESARATVRRWIFQLNLLPKKCNKCNLDKWLDKDIPLELNHINGNGHENRKSNIELLCPNCHALTETYRGKNVVLKYGKAEPRKYDKEKAKKYRESRRKIPKKPNKWHQYKRSKEQFLIERREKRKLEIEKITQTILNSNINFEIRGWRLELAKLLNSTPQHGGNLIKQHIPELWGKCWKHIDNN